MEFETEITEPGAYPGNDPYDACYVPHIPLDYRPTVEDLAAIQEFFDDERRVTRARRFERAADDSLNNAVTRYLEGT